MRGGYGRVRISRTEIEALPPRPFFTWLTATREGASRPPSALALHLRNRHACGAPAVCAGVSRTSAHCGWLDAQALVPRDQTLTTPNQHRSIVNGRHRLVETCLCYLPLQ